MGSIFEGSLLFIVQQLEGSGIEEKLILGFKKVNIGWIFNKE